MNRISFILVVGSLALFVGATAGFAADCLQIDLRVDNRTTSLVGSQEVVTGEWARFDLTFASGRSSMRVGHTDDPSEKPILSFGRHGRRAPRVGMSVAVNAAPLEEERFELEIVQQIARRTAHFDEDWRFTTTTETAVLKRFQPHDIVLGEDADGNLVQATIELNRCAERTLLPACARETLAQARFDAAYRLYELSTDASASSVDSYQEAVKYFREARDQLHPHIKRQGDVLRNRDDLSRETEFSGVVYLPDGDSCYHHFEIALRNLDFSQDESVLDADLYVERTTIHGADAPLGASQYSADVIYIDDYDRHIRLRKGREVEIIVPPGNETTRFPFATLEVLRLVADW